MALRAPAGDAVGFLAARDDALPDLVGDREEEHDHEQYEADRRAEQQTDGGDYPGELPQSAKDHANRTDGQLPHEDCQKDHYLLEHSILQNLGFDGAGNIFLYHTLELLSRV